MSPKKIYLSYEDLHRYSEDLIMQIQTSGYQPTCIVSLAMGGLHVAYHLGKALNLPCYTLHVTSYSHQDQGQLTDRINYHPDLSAHRVLVVDDLVDSGKTLQYVLDRYTQNAQEVKIATRIYKHTSAVAPDFFATKGDDSWVVFPYEIFEK